MAHKLEIHFEENEAPRADSWTVEYENADPPVIPSYLDLSETASARQLVGFVEAVVSAEQPIHIDFLVKRLRDASNIGKVGSRIRATLERAITLAEVQKVGDFLWASESRQVKVRRPRMGEARDIQLIALEEIREAILGVARDATGISQGDLVRSVRQIFGWQRSGPQIEAQVVEEIDFLIENGSLDVSSGGYRLR